MSKRIFVVRHGEIVPHDIENPPLSIGGIEQINRLRNYLSGWLGVAKQVVVSSPTRRCLETAGTLCPRPYLSLICEQLEDWDPSQESFEQMTLGRARPVYSFIKGLPWPDIIIVTHGGLIQGIVSLETGRSVKSIDCPRGTGYLFEGNQVHFLDGRT